MAINMFLQKLSRYVPSGKESELRTKLCMALNTNDLGLMRKLLLWNSLSGAFTAESESFISFSHKFIPSVIKKEYEDMISAILVHEPFRQMKTLALKHAVLSGDPILICEILKHYPDVQVIDDKGETLLHIAVSRWIAQGGIIEILKLFLDLGLNINARTNDGHTPLWIAVKHGKEEVADFLISHGADVNVRCENGNSLISVLLQDENLLYTFEHEKRIDGFKKESNGNLMRLLLSKGIYVNLECCNGSTPLGSIIENNLIQFLPLLVDHTQAKNFKDVAKPSILILFFDVFPQLTTNFDLSYEIFYEKFKMVLKNCSDVNFFNNRNETPLHVVMNNYKNFIETVAKRNEEIISILLAKGADVDLKNSDGMTSIHLAAKHDIPNNAFKMLLQKCSNVNISNNENETPLHIIVDDYKDDTKINSSRYEEIVMWLLTKGADINLKNSAGMTPVHLAAMHKFIRLLVIFKKHGADFKQLTTSGDSMLHLIAKDMTGQKYDEKYITTIKFLIANGCEINALDKNNMTPLLCAMKIKNVSIIAETLIQQGADIHCKDNWGWTPLHYAGVRTGSEKILSMLIERKAEIDCKDSETDATPLHLAAGVNNINAMKQLIAAGANVNLRQKNGQTALHLAVLYGDAITILLKAGALATAKDKNGLSVLHTFLKKDDILGFNALVKHNCNFDQIDLQREIFSVPNFKNKIVWIKLIEYLVKRRVINFPVSDMYDPYIDLENKELQDLYQRCLMEIEVLKKSHAVDQIKFYDLMQMNPEKRYPFMKKMAFRMQLYSANELNLKFPEYSLLILGNYFEAITAGKRMHLRKKCFKAWYDVTQIYLDEICVEKIIYYLDDCTLEKICKEYKSEENQS